MVVISHGTRHNVPIQIEIGLSIPQAPDVCRDLSLSRPVLVMEMQEPPESRPGPARPTLKADSAPHAGKDEAKQVISYRYSNKRKNNPEVGMVDTSSDGVEEKNAWTYDRTSIRRSISTPPAPASRP